MGKRLRMYEVSNPEREAQEEIQRAAEARQEANIRLAHNLNSLTPEQIRYQQENAPRKLRHEVNPKTKSRRDVGRQAIRESLGGEG